MIYIQWLFCWSLITSTTVALSARTPIYLWARLEVNTIAFIPIILNPAKPERVRAAIKYFFVQAYASLIFLVGPVLSSMPEFTIFVSMVIKLGISPFHNWYPSVINNLDWSGNLILSTWQKIAPLWILSENTFNSSLLPILAALNAIVGGLGGIAQTEVRPLLAFSSIGHIGWLVYALRFSNSVTYLYFISYSLHLVVLIHLIQKRKITTPKDISSSRLISPQTKLIMAFLLFSLGGLPPLFGFIPKLIVLFMGAQYSVLPLFLIFGSYINIYYYITLIWASFITNAQPILQIKELKNILLLSTTLTTSLRVTLI